MHNPPDDLTAAITLLDAQPLAPEAFVFLERTSRRYHLATLEQMRSLSSLIAAAVDGHDDPYDVPVTCIRNSPYQLKFQRNRYLMLGR